MKQNENNKMNQRTVGKRFTEKHFLRSILLVILLTASMLVNAQIFNFPKYNAKSKEHITLERIEVTDNETRVTLSVNTLVSDGRIYADNDSYRPNLQILIPDDCYLVQTGTNNRYLFKGIVNAQECQIKVGQRKIIPFNETAQIILAFKKIDETIPRIDLRCGNINFFDIVLFEEDLPAQKSFTERGKFRDKNKEWSFIKNPGYLAKSGSSFRITMVELRDTATVLHFEADVHGGDSWSFSVPAQSCIIPSFGGEPMYVKYAEGVSINELVRSKEQGTKSYKLYFPPLDKKVEKINFKEMNKGGNWFVYELEVR